MQNYRKRALPTEKAVILFHYVNSVKRNLKDKFTLRKLNKADVGSWYSILSKV